MRNLLKHIQEPSHPGLIAVSNHGWIDDEQAEVLEIMNSSRRFKENLASKIQTFFTTFKKTHYTSRSCNNPEDWGENKQGPFTEWFNQEKSSMINLISMGILSGYKLFICLLEINPH